MKPTMNTSVKAALRVAVKTIVSRPGFKSGIDTFPIVLRLRRQFTTQRFIMPEQTLLWETSQ
ncbi:hypothetical protein [Geosporobacter ferrireducens]|uniref:Uncharacterized protein n=1 Tax=Geosporobacter ferrireducens TaxID=1424294 RepID=A0A1D8GPS2_9FIRM|nr:hypothetical protein [Geosporobacter ferrireducens]AOT72878.1 hypothetical protein Gferi_26975 [Geosporobacter ferrireducens]MTI55285.1 hypothetical protein [Geosporobacter ferrireducens]